MSDRAKHVGGAHHWSCPGCDHEIIGVKDWDECVELMDDHLQQEHGLTVQQYMEDGMSGGIDVD